MKGLLISPLRGGVYEVKAEATLSRQLRHAGWHVGVADLVDARQAVEEIGRQLGFPSYYGKNLDALNDCLSDLERPTALIIARPKNLSRYGLAMLEMLTERAESDQGVPFALVQQHDPSSA